ncbi:MAG: putative nuclease of putative toxin-antitoxin system [Candidatus Poriferisodalaceae bacterium]
MKLLFDQNLSRHLVVEFADSRHATEVGLDSATDNEIWTYAGEHGFVIVSKDSDFRQLAFLNGPPPKAIWLRLGNASTTEILVVLRKNQGVMQVFSESEDEALLVIESTMTPDE